MIDATLDMLRTHHKEHVAHIGVIGALFCDDLPEAVRRLECCRDAAREYAKTINGRKDREAQQIAYRVATVAEDLIPGVRMLAERAE